MTDLVKRLRAATWMDEPPTMLYEEAADRIEALERECAELRPPTTGVARPRPAPSPTAAGHPPDQRSDDASRSSP
jgi:hypothetical protein